MTKIDGMSPVTVPLGDVPLSDAARAELRSQVEKNYEHAQKQFEKRLIEFEALAAPNQKYKPTAPNEIKNEEFDKLIQVITGEKKKPGRFFLSPYLSVEWKGAWGPPDVQLIHVIRFLHACDRLTIRDRDCWLQDPGILDRYRGLCPVSFGLRDVAAAIATLPGGNPEMVAMHYLAGNNSYRSTFDWEADAIWPLFAEHKEILHAALGPSSNRGGHYQSYDWGFNDRRASAFRVLAMFPKLPDEFIPVLWKLALGESKTDRIPAQEALATVEGKIDTIIAALADGKQDIRTSAAEWLGRLGDKSAIEPLKAAFRKEKLEYAKGVYMTSLESLGADVSEFLDRKKLQKEAEAGLAKKRPKGMDWFPCDSLPAVHWADSGELVSPEILQWWVVQTVQQKSPACGPLLRRYLLMCRTTDAANLGKFVLSSWIGRDTRHPSQEEAAELATKATDTLWNMHGQQAWFLDSYKSRDNLYQILFQNQSDSFLGSAIGEKGMLAIVSSVGNTDCVKLCEQYVRKYFGTRLAQCKALIEVLAWMKHPLAIQVLLSISNRFRTKSLRQAATDYVQALAEREGWTIDELADRTIPDAGFARPVDEDGQPTGTVAELVLDYGPRSFIVRLDDELEPVVTREDGKTVKAPPAPAKSDDEEKAKAAKKAFTDAKKLVKELIKRQAERFYEAMCTQRAWRFEDWKRFLLQHPIVGKICTRIVWSAFEPGHDGEPDTFVTNFRPLEDGSLTDEHDDTVTCQDGMLIRVAHDCNTPAESRSLWIQHLLDYDVKTLFQQFGRSGFTLSADLGETTEIKSFEGHMLTTFQLRGKAVKLGWQRGEAEDGGCFVLYRKPFPSLKLQAVLEFTGSFLPEDDIPAALKTLSFEPIKNAQEETSSWSRSALPLKKIPPVLLNECYNDVQQIAASGTGFAADWESKSYF